MPNLDQPTPSGARTLLYYHVDAFTSELFSGNPAGVVLGAEGLPDSTLQAIAAENNLSETAFLLREGPADTEPAAADSDPGIGIEKIERQLSRWRLRWFTPKVEIDLCGHATLAAAFVLILRGEPSIMWFNTRSGILHVAEVQRLSGTRLEMVFPVVNLSRPADEMELSWLSDALGCPVKEAYTCEAGNEEQLLSGAESSVGGTPGLHPHRGKWMVVLDNAEQVRRLEPDMKALEFHASHSLIVTAPGDGAGKDEDLRSPAAASPSAKGSSVTLAQREMIPPGDLPRCEEGASAPVNPDLEPGQAGQVWRPDFVSRFFAPALGIPEDPVTGSAHCALTPYWSRRLRNKMLAAEQLSERGGRLWCMMDVNPDRVRICGTARLYMQGSICIL